MEVPPNHYVNGVFHPINYPAIGVPTPGMMFESWSVAYFCPLEPRGASRKPHCLGGHQHNETGKTQ